MVTMVFSMITVTALIIIVTIMIILRRFRHGILGLLTSRAPQSLCEVSGTAAAQLRPESALLRSRRLRLSRVAVKDLNSSYINQGM